MIKGVKLSEATSIALHSIILIAIRNEMTNVNTVYEILGGSKAHIAKVLQKLSREGLISSIRGPKGGFKLDKSPQDIMLIDVYEAIEGRLNIKTCALEKIQCVFGECIFGSLLKNVKKEIYEFFITNSIADVLKQISKASLEI